MYSFEKDIFYQEVEKQLSHPLVHLATLGLEPETANSTQLFCVVGPHRDPAAKAISASRVCINRKLELGARAGLSNEGSQCGMWMS